MAGARRKPNKRSGKYQAYYADWRGRRVFVVGTASRKETLDIARKLEDEQRQIRLGYNPHPRRRHDTVVGRFWRLSKSISTGAGRLAVGTASPGRRELPTGKPTP